MAYVMASPSSSSCMERRPPSCWSPQEPTLIHGQLQHTACRPRSLAYKVCSPQAGRHICCRHQDNPLLIHELKENPWGVAEYNWFKKRWRYRVLVHIMTQEALQDAHFINGGRAIHVEARVPSYGVSFGSSSSLQTLEAFSYEELLNQVMLSRNHVDQQGILLHLVKRCSSERDLMMGREVHRYVEKCGFASDAFLGSQLIQMYASLELLVEANEVFNRLPELNVFLWTAIISAHVNLGENERAILLYFRLQSSSVEPDGPVFMAALKACATATALNEGKLIHADIVESGWESHTFVGNTLIDMYAKCGSLQDASTVFDRLPGHDIVAWNAMLAGYSQHGYSQKALEVFEEMQRQGLTLSPVTFICILKACATLGTLDVGKHIHTLIIEKGLNFDLSVSSALVDMYAKCGSIHDAGMVFERIQGRDVVIWSTLIAAYGQDSRGHDALELFEKMQHEGVMPNQITYNNVLKACSSIAAFEEGKWIHSLVIESGCESNIFLSSTLVDMYSKSGDLEHARAVFDRSVKQDVSIWNAMIGGYAQHGHGQEALQLFYQMQQNGVEPDRITPFSILKACSCVSALEQGRWIHAHIISNGFVLDIHVGSTLIGMYDKCGSLEDASVVFESMPERDVAVWNTMIAGYAHHSNYNEAYCCFNAMQQAGFMPDDVTYLCLLIACSRVGLANEGCLHFKSMVSDHCIPPTLELYVSLLDCVGRAGRLDEAEDLIESFPFYPNDVGWMSLLGSCRAHTNVDLGRRCFDNLIQKDQENATGYVFMANIYSQAGMEEDAKRIEKARSHAKVWKKPAKAFIEVNNKVHDFIVGDKTHASSSEIYAKIKELTFQMREDGCMSFVNPASEDALSGHCEKLAIAFGLISTPIGATIRVSKNLRMCDDCHHTSKFISRVELREIVVNDAFCTHHFKDGVCSCKDHF